MKFLPGGLSGYEYMVHYCSDQDSFLFCVLQGNIAVQTQFLRSTFDELTNELGSIKLLPELANL